MNKLIAIALILSISTLSVRAVTAGNPVACGTASSPAGGAPTCTTCGTTAAIQALFSPGASGSSNCMVIDCTATVASGNLNGWICSSCNGVTGSTVTGGQYFYNSKCSSTCTGATAANGQTCTASSSVIVFTMLLSLLALLF